MNYSNNDEKKEKNIYIGSEICWWIKREPIPISSVFIKNDVEFYWFFPKNMNQIVIGVLISINVINYINRFSSIESFLPSTLCYTVFFCLIISSQDFSSLPVSEMSIDFFRELLYSWDLGIDGLFSSILKSGKIFKSFHDLEKFKYLEILVLWVHQLWMCSISSGHVQCI